MKTQYLDHPKCFLTLDLASSGRIQTWAGSLRPSEPSHLKEDTHRDNLRNREILFLWETALKERVEEELKQNKGENKNLGWIGFLHKTCKDSTHF